MDSNYVFGILTGSGVLGIAGSLIAWVRNRRKDKAEANQTEAGSIKTLAEAYEVKIKAETEIIAQWKKLTDELNAQIKELRDQIEEERKECDEKIGILHKRISELEKNGST